MLVYISDMKNLPFSEICRVYQQSIECSVGESSVTLSERFWQEEHGLYQELQDFFSRRNGTLALWRTEHGIQSALRLEKWNDGYLLQSLETHPESRRKGFALHLVKSVLADCPRGTILYSHVKKDNIASMQLHLHCGFQVHSDMARLLDGTVSNRYVTMKFLKE